MKHSSINTYTYLKNNLNFANTPGWVAQKEMAPPYRQKLVDEAKYDLSQPKIAAVLILIYTHNNELYIPLIHRNSYHGVHSNQIGFPGGKIETYDKDLSATAIRESFEEINALPSKIEILGELTELFIPPSNYIVYPFVGYYKETPNFSASDREVKDIIPLALKDFTLNPKITKKTIGIENKKYQVPGFLLPNQMICWGATAMMLNEFRILLKNNPIYSE